MTRYRPSDLERLGPDAKRQIELVRFAENERTRQQDLATRSKYGNKRVCIDGKWFDSQVEAKRWQELRMLQRSGSITNLIRQPSFDITVMGVYCGCYKADFSYMDMDGNITIEDVKSPATAKNAVYRLKKRIVEALHSITITEVVFK